METTATTTATTTAMRTHIRVCGRCGRRYDWRRSPSTFLKMTYCGSLCEQADLGFTIEALLRVERASIDSEQVTERPAAAAAEPESPAQAPGAPDGDKTLESQDRLWQWMAGL
jgi:hypothetical protein